MPTHPSSLFPSGFPTKNIIWISVSPMHATFSSYVILLDLITLIICGEAYSYDAPHYAVFSSLPPLSPP
jgi:hypothetical protein